MKAHLDLSGYDFSRHAPSLVVTYLELDFGPTFREYLNQRQLEVRICPMEYLSILPSKRDGELRHSDRVGENRLALVLMPVSTARQASSFAAQRTFIKRNHPSK